MFARNLLKLFVLRRACDLLEFFTLKRKWGIIMSKAVKITIVVVVAILVILSIVGLIFLLKPNNLPNTSLTQRLATPTNVRLDTSNWMLTFDPVENAESYQIVVNGGENIFVTNQTQVNVSAYIRNYALYSFTVRALHSTSDYNSYPSDVVYGENSTTLATPTSLTMNSDVLYWGQVPLAESYNIYIVTSNSPDELDPERAFKSDTNNFDFSTILNQAPYSELDFFSFYVQATSTNLITGESNQYIRTSELSEPQNYFKTRSITPPTIRLDPIVTNNSYEQGTIKTLYWDLDYAVESYEVFVDGVLVTTIKTEDLDFNQEFALNLNDLSINGVPITDTLGEHSIYITAVAKYDPNVVIASQTSNTITYLVKHKLSTPNSETVQMYKEGNNLVIKWDPVSDINPYDPNTPYIATSYNLILWANMNPDDENSTYFNFRTIEQLVTTTYTISLDELAATGGKAFRVQIQAVREGNAYIYNSDYCELSSGYNAVTKMQTPTDVRVIDANGVYSLTWREVSGAQAGYLVSVYDADIVDGELQVGSLRLSQTVYTTNIQISDYMSANNLEAGLYAVRVLTKGYSSYFTDSDPSDYAELNYKVRLDTPVIQRVERAEGTSNKRQITMYFTYVENAQYYYINVDGNLAGTIVQPAEKPADGLIVDEFYVSNYINGYDVPAQYKITVQAVVRDNLDEINYINSVVSAAYPFVNSYKHSAPDYVKAMQEPGSNVVSLTWGEVGTVTNSGGRYNVEVNGTLLTNVDTTGTSIDDISNYLVLGENTISVYAADSGQLYEASDRTTITFNYSYVLSGSSQLRFDVVSGERQIQITIPAFNRYVTNYYLEFSTGKTISVTCEAGQDAVFNVGFDYLPLYENVTITVYAGKIDANTNQPNLTPCSWTDNFTNDLYIEAPSISLDEENYILTLSVTDVSIPYTSSIEWRFTGTTGVTYTAYITDFSTGGTFTFDLRELGLINDGEELLVGSYNIYASTIGNANNLRSEEASYAFVISKKLATPTGFVQADDNSYLQWNYIEDVESYSVKIDGTTYDDVVIGEYTAVIDGVYTRVIRLTIPSGVFGAAKVYNFEIQALAGDNIYYFDSDVATYEWDFSNKLASPVVDAVQRNNQWNLRILYNNLVSNYTITSPQIPELNSSVSSIQDGYVYLNIETLLASRLAGEYTFSVVANPRDAETYTPSDATNYVFTWTKLFDTPVINVSQDMDTNEVNINWDAITAELVDGSFISPSGYSVVVTSVSDGRTIVNTTADTNNYTITGTELAQMTSGDYFVSVTALGNGAMRDSYIGSVRFVYQEQLSAPQIVFMAGGDYATVVDGSSATISATLDSRAYQFDLKIELLDSSGEIADSNVYTNLTWSNNTYTLLGEVHFTERGIYKISVRSSQNGRYAPSPWSNELVVYFAQSFAVADNIVLDYDDAQGQFVVTFDALTLPELISDVTYSAVVEYNNGGTTDSVNIDSITGETFTFAGDENWVNAWNTQFSTFTITITANTSAIPCTPSDLGLSEFNFAPTSSTVYSFIIGSMTDPTNIEMTANGQSITITWSGDKRYPEKTYYYSVQVVAADGTSSYLTESGWGAESAELNTTNETLTFTLPTNAVYGIHFTVRSQFDTIQSKSVTKIFVNTANLADIDDFTITYNTNSGSYLATWTNVLQNSVSFTGATYRFTLNGQDVSLDSVDISGSTVSVPISNDIINNALAAGRSATWAITATEGYYQVGDEQFVAYNSQLYSNFINLPVVIIDAPTNLTIDGTEVTWSPVTFATRYQIYISETENGEVLDGRTAFTTSTSYDISTLVEGLGAGQYYVVVTVAEDTENGIYTTVDTGKASVGYTQYTSISGIERLNLTTITNSGRFVNYVTWYYDEHYTTPEGDYTDVDVKFDVYITDSEGVVTYVVEDATATRDAGAGNNGKFYFVQDSQNANKATYYFNYLDGTPEDVSRKILAGECLFSVVVKGYGAYLDSAPTSTNYTNKFALSKIENADLFTIVPDLFVENVVDHEVVNESADLDAYEESYGFNEKYLIIKNDTLSYAQYFKVYISTKTDSDGSDIFEYVGTIENKATELTYDAIVNTTAKLRLPNAVSGLNKIKIVPWGDEEYYKYVEGSTEYFLSEAEDKLASIFDYNLYMRNDAPLLTALSIDLGYSDSPTNHNVSKVNIVFRNAQNGMTYRVTPHYKDYYNSDTETVGTPFDITLTDADFDNNVPLGLAVYEYIKTYGPHEFWFDVQAMASGEYELNSHISTTPNTFNFITKLMEFAPSRNGDASVNSLVTEVTADNADEFAENGSLYWTLPPHPYSIKVRYTVTMSDLTQEYGIVQMEPHKLEYSAYLNIIVADDGSITYTIEQGETKYFVLDTPNNRLIFDMTAYFENTARAGSTGMYYLAGTYEYMITATAFDKNGNTFATRIFSPAPYGTENSMMPYTYRDIPYPFTPIDIQLDSSGVLSWGFNDTIYGNSEYINTAKFTIVVRNWNDSHTEYTEFTREVEGDYSADISDLLIAGGHNRNDVYIYTNSPFEYYLDSEWVEVDTRNLQSSTDLPGLSLSWDDHREVEISLNTDISQAVYQDIINNGNTVWISVSILKLNWSIGDPTPAPTTYDEVRASGNFIDEVVWNQPATEDFYNYITYYHGMLDYSFNFVNELNVLSSANEILASTWLSGGDSLASGYYYIKVQLQSSSTYYASSSAESEKMVREVWRSSTADATIEGPHLTTKMGDSELANPVNGNDRLWGEDQYKDAYLSIYVNTISQVVDGVTYYRLPSTITVTARLYTNPGYDVENYYSMTYNIPDPSMLGTSDTYIDPDNPDVRINRCYVNGQVDNSRVQVVMNIHLLFDTNINAGVYHIYWVLDGNEVGDSSPSTDPYRLNTEVCHYVILPTPILDYRLDYTGTNYESYVLNWILTPDKYTYQVNESCEYNLNIFAFEQTEDGSYASDILYNSLSAEEQALFLSAERRMEYFVNNANVTTKLIEYKTVSELNGRDCYIHLDTDSGMHLTPNKSYKIYVFLSTPGWNESMPLSERNKLYYLPSDTSVGVEYLYKEVSGQHQNASVSVTQDYPLENTDIANGAYYTFVSTQPDNYNNAFELYVYNTQDPRAATDRDWTAKQEAEGTYLAHWIIGTRDNVSAADGSQNLYILYDYQDRKIGSGNWAYTLGDDWRNRAIGYIVDRSISFDQLTMTELLYNEVNQDLTLNKILTPITYYCKIKTWINNNDVNANAPTLNDAGEYYEDDVIYSKKWIRNHIPYVKNEDGSINEEMVDNFYNELQESQITVPFLDINSLNPSYYFTFQHQIKYAMPTLPEVNGIEILNKDGSSDYVDYTYVGAVDGYVIDDANYGYYYRIWLDNLYTTDPLIRNDKVINMEIGYTTYSDEDGGSSGRGNAGNVWTWQGSAQFEIHYVDDPEDENYQRAYIELMYDSPEAGAGGEGGLYAMLDAALPNIVSFRFTAVTDAKPTINVGEDNTYDSFLTANNAQKGTFDGITSQMMYRVYHDSDMSQSDDYLTVFKQYTVPDITLMFDDMTNELKEATSMQKYEGSNGTLYDTNLVSDVSKGDYTGLAANTYIYTRPDSLNWNSDHTAGQRFEYGMVSTNLNTTYEIKLTYAGRSTTVTIRTHDVNATLTEFTNAVNQSIASGNTVDETRFDYSNYVDKYPYEVSCLYKALYDLINESTPTSSGQYHGGLVDIDIRTVAPSGEDALNWVTSRWASEARETGLYSFYFYARLETVKTTFNQNEANFDDYSENGISSHYCYDGSYYYYQSYIPLHYESISRDVNYYIYLTRDAGTVEGRRTYNETYSIDNAIVRDACTIRPSNTNAWNIKNLTDILKIDLMTPEDANSINQGSNENHRYNQWALPVHESDTWHINIIAAVDDSMEYVGRGFNSKSAGMDYTVNLEIKMDIQSLSMTLEPLVNKSNNTIAALQTSHFVDSSTGMWYNYSTTQDKQGQEYNMAPNRARFLLYYPYQQRWLSVSKWFSIEQNTETRYYDLFYDYIKEVLIDDPEMRGSDGFKIRVQFGYYLSGDFNNNHIHNSDYSVELLLDYYRQLPFDTTRISFSQSGSTIVMNADYSVNNQFERLEVTINQYNRESNKRLTKSNINISKSGSSMISYRATGYFEYNNADCFSSDSYSNADIDDCINGYLTSYTGYVQGGDNWFTVTPIHDGYEVEHNLLEKGISYDDYCDFDVLIHPSASFDYDTETYTESFEATSKWIWKHDAGSDSSAIEQETQSPGSWGYITNASISTSYMRGGSMKASWEYGFEISESDLNNVRVDFPEVLPTYQGMIYSSSSNGSTSMTFSRRTNYLNINVTTHCKPGFESVFSGGGSWSFNLSVSQGDGVQSFVPRTKAYVNQDDVMNYVSAEVTGGGISSARVEHVLDVAGAVLFDIYRRTVTANVKVTYTGPEGFSFTVDLGGASVSGDSVILGQVIGSRSGSTDGGSVRVSGGSGSTTLRGQTAEQGNILDAAQAYNANVSGSVSGVSFGGR